MNQQVGWALLAILFSAAAVGAVVLSSMLYQDATKGPASLAGLLLTGAVTFFLAVGGLVALFHALGLTTLTEPLGLPAGTVRALIALVLILLFFIMAVFLYLDVSQTTTDTRLVGLSQEQVAALPANTILSQSPRTVVVRQNPDGTVETKEVWDVVLASPRATSEVAQEMARQLITSLGTLIAAIAAFYFGAKMSEGSSAGNEAANLSQRLRALQQQLDAGTLTPDAYASKTKDLLARS